MKSFFAVVCIGVFSAMAVAAACPDGVDRSDALTALRAPVQAAGTEMEGRIYDRQMWKIWTTAPTTEAQALLDSSMQKIGTGDFAGALSDLDALVAFCSSFAEGWNQRAFAHFLRQDFDAAPLDLDKALALNPDHTEALSGKALSLIGMGRIGPAG